MRLSKATLLAFLTLGFSTGQIGAGTLFRISLDSAIITTSPWDIGPPSSLIDGSADTILRSANINPAFVQFEFPSSQSVRKVKVLLGQPGFAGDVDRWWVEAADTISDLNSRSGTYRALIGPRSGVAGWWDEATLTENATKRVWRFKIQRTVGDNYVHIRELELWTELQLPNARLEMVNVTSDATSVQLQWKPLSPGVVQEYAVYRDGALIGSTISQTGFFHDFGLLANHTYQYEVFGMGVNGLPLAASDALDVSTKSVNAMRTHYTILAIAFNPDTTALEASTTYLKHRIDFLTLASLGSAVIDPYQQRIVWIPEDPPLVQGSVLKSADIVRTTTQPYNQLGGYSIVDLIEKGDIDGVWLVNCSAPGFGENTLFGNRNIGRSDTHGEKWVSIKVKCSRSFFVNGYEPDARSYDAYTHMVEGIMSSMCDSYPANWPRDTEYLVFPKSRADRTPYQALLHLFERFRLADEWNGPGAYASKGNANCGSSHFPPNTPFECLDYAYFDLGTWQRYAECTADDWFNFPDLRGISRKLNGYDFGAFNYYQENHSSYAPQFGGSPERHPSFAFSSASYHQWWFRHLPHNPGVTDGKLNNWWPYLFDFNRFDGRAIDFEVTGFPIIPTEFTPLQGEYGTEEDQPNHWGYWHSENGFSPFGKHGELSVISKLDSSTNVRCGTNALKVEVENAEWWEWWDRGRNDVFYPLTRNAQWDLSKLTRTKLSIKLADNPVLVTGVNPIVRLCANDGNRIEFVPVRNGTYVNLLRDCSRQDGYGWYSFKIPMAGNDEWEKNVFGYIDPTLDAAAQAQARWQLEKGILAKVNYVEISIQTTRNYPANVNVEHCSFLVDGLEFDTSSGNEPVDVSAQVSVTRTGFRFNRATQRFVQTLTLRNSGGSAISGPIFFELADLSPNASLYNSTGPVGIAGVFVNVGPDRIFAQTELATVSLEFTNPGNLGITYHPRVWAAASP